MCESAAIVDNPKKGLCPAGCWRTAKGRLATGYFRCRSFLLHRFLVHGKYVEILIWAWWLHR